MAKVRFVGRCRVSDTVLAQHRSYARRLGLPEVGSREVHPNLAVVGGSPSVTGYLDELRKWNGEIWAINGVWKWLKERGIDATFYTIDPNDFDPQLIDGAVKAVLADTVPPWVFDKIPDVELARLGGDAILYGTTSACTAPIIAAHRGHARVSLFGCESSFGAQSHAYKNEEGPFLWVSCGEEFKTSPQMLMQAEWLAEMARSLPNFIEIRSGGFLQALTERGDYDLTATSSDLAEILNP